jgi:S1-C subfamily serine protease
VRERLAYPNSQVTTCPIDRCATPLAHRILKSGDSPLENSLLSFSNQLASIAEQSAPGIVAVHSHPRAAASGVHWRPGVIVTAEHALRRDDEVRIVTASGEELKAEIAGRDPGSDLAVLKVSGFDAPVAAQAAVGDAKAGNLVLALGRSRGGGLTASLGIVSSVNGPWQTWRGGRLDRYVRLDLSVYPGASGGPVIDAGGQAIGIATVALSRTSPIAIPVETVNRVTDSLLAHGTVPRGFIGVGLQPVALPDHLKSKLNLTQDTGLIVVSVHPSGPAESAGIMIGDLLVELAGKAVADTDDVQGALEGSVGKSVPARVVRGGANVNLDITVGLRPHRSC